MDLTSISQILHVFQISRSVNTEAEVKDESLENGFSTPRISDNSEYLMRIQYPVLFLIFNLFYWFTYRHTG